MLALSVITSPDRGLAWLIYVLLAFLLASIVVGALVGPQVLDGHAPGALHEGKSSAPDHQDPGAGHHAE